jgi:hypothetical protein
LDLTAPSISPVIFQKLSGNFGAVLVLDLFHGQSIIMKAGGALL